MEKTKKVRLSEEEFNKLPQKEKDRLIAARNVREAAIKAKAAQSVDAVFAENTTETAKARAFNKVYKSVRQALVILKAKKASGQDINAVCAETKATLNKAISLLDA